MTESDLQPFRPKVKGTLMSGEFSFISTLVPAMDRKQQFSRTSWPQTLDSYWWGENIYQRKTILLWIKTEINTPGGKNGDYLWPTNEVRGISSHDPEPLLLSFFLSFFWIAFLLLYLIYWPSFHLLRTKFLGKYSLLENDPRVIYT